MEIDPDVLLSWHRCYEAKRSEKITRQIFAQVTLSESEVASGHRERCLRHAFLSCNDGSFAGSRQTSELTRGQRYGNDITSLARSGPAYGHHRPASQRNLSERQRTLHPHATRLDETPAHPASPRRAQIGRAACR